MKFRIKKTYICRQVDNWKLETEGLTNYQPQVGDVGFFEVLHIGKHRNVQSDSKRNTAIFVGDQILAAFGTRYATGQFEGYVPDHVNKELHILGAGGTVGEVKSMHARFTDIGPTKLKLIGLAKDNKGELINTKKIMDHRMLPFTGATAAATKVILSLGASMDSGKTTSAAYLVHGLKKSGFTVAYIKLTGTAYTKDADLAWDMGADIVADFSDFGFPSTYMCSKQELLSLYESLLNKALIKNPDFVIMEIADGLFERETKMLLTDATFMSTVEGAIFSAGDSLATISGVHILHKWGIYPMALCGLFTASPLLINEVQENISIPVFTLEDLASGNQLISFLTKNKAFAGNQ